MGEISGICLFLVTHFNQELKRAEGRKRNAFFYTLLAIVILEMAQLA